MERRAVSCPKVSALISWIRLCWRALQRQKGYYERETLSSWSSLPSLAAEESKAAMNAKSISVFGAGSNIKERVGQETKQSNPTHPEYI